MALDGKPIVNPIMKIGMGTTSAMIAELHHLSLVVKRAKKGQSFWMRPVCVELVPD